jgi:hypothetical protein
MSRIDHERVASGRPSRIAGCAVLAACLFAAGCGGVTDRHHASQRSTGPSIAVLAPASTRVAIEGGTQPERRLLRTILAASHAGAIRGVWIFSRPGRLSFLVGRTDSESSTRGKWIAKLVGSAFADASARRGLPKIGSLTIRVPGLPVAEGSRLVLRLPPTAAAASSGGLSRGALAAIVGAARARGIEARRLVAFRLAAQAPEAVELTGRFRHPATTYLRVLSETAAAPVAGMGAYYELADESGAPVLRFGIVNGLAQRDRLVAWVRPDVLKRP